MEWKTLHSNFLKKADYNFMTPLESFEFKFKFNSVNTANSKATVNLENKIIKEDDTANLLDVIAKKMITSDKKVEQNAQKQPIMSINCDALKNIFEEHESSTPEGAQVVDNEIAIKSKQRFIAAHIDDELSLSESQKDDDKKNSHKKLITEDIYQEWLKDFSAPSTTSYTRENLKDLGIFPQHTNMNNINNVTPKNLLLDSLLM